MSPSRWSSILQGDIQSANQTIQLPEGETATGFIMKWLTHPEVEYIDPNDPEGPKRKLPGYPSLAGRKATKEEIAEATGGAAGELKGKNRLEGETREQYEAAVRKRYPNATEAQIRAAVEAEYG